MQNLFSLSPYLEHCIIFIRDIFEFVGECHNLLFFLVQIRLLHAHYLLLVFQRGLEFVKDVLVGLRVWNEKYWNR